MTARLQAPPDRLLLTKHLPPCDSRAAQTPATMTWVLLPTPPLALAAAAGRPAVGQCRLGLAARDGLTSGLQRREPGSAVAVACSMQNAAALVSGRATAVHRVALASRGANRCRSSLRPQAASQPLWTPAAAERSSSSGPSTSGSGGGGGSGGGSQSAQQGRESAPNWLRPLPPAIMPWQQWYLQWNAVATFSAAVTAFLVPWEVAFVPAEQLYSFISG